MVKTNTLATMEDAGSRKGVRVFVSSETKRVLSQHIGTSMNTTDSAVRNLENSIGNVYSRKHGKVLARPAAGLQGWRTTVDGAREAVFCVCVNGELTWVDRTGLGRLKHNRKNNGTVFASRRGFALACAIEGETGYEQASGGGRVRVIFSNGRWIRERVLLSSAWQVTNFVVPVADQTAE